MPDQKWSDKEKKTARRAFDAALDRERAALLAEFKQKALDAQGFDDLWAIHAYLEKTLRAIDAKYDYRYSKLVFVFAVLLRERRLSEAELEGLSADKLATIRQIADLR
ncbi:MAG: uncharacterized protein JWR40_3967 [Massilia sp.]|jgi:hypothetical protein|nr:uncharacterized protein [Massilia sp.]